MARDVNDPLGKIAVDPPTTTSSIVMPISSHDRPCVRWGKGKKRETLVTDPAPWEIAVEEDPGPSPFGVGRVYIAPSFSPNFLLSYLVSCLVLISISSQSSRIHFPSPPLFSSLYRARSRSILQPRMKTSISSDVWEKKKALIAKLYMEEEWPLKQVIKQIRSDDFNPR